MLFRAPETRRPSQIGEDWRMVGRMCAESLSKSRRAIPKECGEILGLIGKLYAIERQARDGPSVIELRKTLRDKGSRKIIEEIHSWALQTKTLGESPLRKAVDSTESELPAASR